MTVPQSQDLETIRLIEAKLGLPYYQLALENIEKDDNPKWNFSLNENMEVIGLLFRYLDITPIQKYIRQLKRLSKLDISYCHLKKNVSFLSALKDLTSLSLRGNNLKDISFLRDLQGLKSLDLSVNELKDVSALRGLTGLTDLNLCINQIEDVSFLRELKNLTSLVLVENNLKNVAFLWDLKGLTSLYLDDVDLGDASFLQGLKGLTTLYLARVYLNDFSILGELKNLRSLSLTQNNIKDISFLQELDHLTDLLIHDNPIENPPLEIVKQGLQAIRDYLRALEEGEEKKLNEVKVLLVGDGGAGKSSLVKRLIGEDFNINEGQTKGIHISPWIVKKGENEIKAHLWDFGGQEIMHASHQFFLSKRSLYILVLDCRKDEKTEYWLKHIESFGGDSPVLVVINKIDENPGYEVNRKFLKEKYKNIQGFFRVSCQTKEGIDIFIGALTKSLWHVDILKTMWPVSWFYVKSYLERMTEHFISYTAYQKICLNKKVTEESSQDTLLDFLNDLGTILNFRTLELKDTHVLEPRWVTEAVYKIINSDKLAKCNGVLNLNLLDTILKQKDESDFIYPPDKYRYIIELMKKFELCYTMEDERVLIPDLLVLEEMDFDFDYASSLKFIIEYDFLPKSVMPRFIVRMHKDIKDNLQWRTGVVLEEKAYQTTAVIKADERDRKISICVNGEQKRDFFSIIRKTIRDINGSFKKMETKELVPLPDNDKITVEYEELIGYESAGKSEIFIGKLKKGYNVSLLLNGIVSFGERKNEYTRMERKGDLYLQLNQTQNVSQKIAVKQETNIAIDIDIRSDLPALKSDFFKLKDALEEAAEIDPKLKKELQKIEDSFDQLTLEPKKKELAKPLNKVGRLLENLGDDDSRMGKILNGTQKGIDLAQKLGKTYNKLAQWVALPQIPDLFLGGK